jgi:hypothetical protein
MSDRLKGSITLDSNPEGINQYSGSSSANAHAATKQAKTLNTKEAHTIAMKAHLRAANQHDVAHNKIGNEMMLKNVSSERKAENARHISAAAEHRNYADKHRAVIARMTSEKMPGKAGLQP